MASTESAGVISHPAIRLLTEADLSGCVALSRAADWNQNEADWRMMLAMGRGWGIDIGTDARATAAARGGQDNPDGDQRRAPVLAASALVIPYPALPGAAAPVTGCAWVSMVLVLPQFRRRGLATRLLREALAYLRDQGSVPVLDATPAGYPVYLQEGFEPAWGFRRYRRAAVSLDPDAADAPRTRRIVESDWPAILALDAPAFGADRSRLLRALALRMPSAARVAEAEGRVSGFILGRDGLEACQLGPLIARDAGTAQILIDDVLDAVAGPVQVDLADRHLELLQGLVARGFLLQRPFTRMAHGAAAPGDPSQVVLVAGPELG
jgi:GNAT superfamily N-acetyltransferase